MPEVSVIIPVFKIKRNKIRNFITIFGDKNKVKKKW